MVEIKGYKGFSKDLKNEAGDQFEVGKIYTTSNNDDLLFGPTGNGYHFCESLSDCFIFFNPEESIYAEVIGLDEVRMTDYPQKDIYGVYVARSIRIDRIIPPEEIIEMFIHPEKGIWQPALKRFIQLYPLTDEQIIELEKENRNDFYTLQDIMYYQRQIKDVYKNHEQVFEYQKTLRKRYESSSE